VLLAVWADVGEHMRRYLEAATLADIVTMAQGQAPWPGEDMPSPTVTPPWAGSR
jgi:DNA-binding IscR family transcriptional regulator